ncbi:MAG: adenylate cyclase [Glaciecola sp.]|jgi:TolB-like protein/Flp pilus assembly protein TadD
MNIYVLYSEIRRRKVIRVAFVYGIVAWLIVQIAETIFQPLQLPPWSLTLVIVLVALGLPIAIILAWAFEITPEGVVLDVPANNKVSALENIVVDDPPSIAVLAFEDMSEEKNQGYFCDGIAEEIMNVISKVDVLRVASRTSSFQYKNKSTDIKKIGQQLKVKTILEGSVRKQGNHIRITAQLINTQDGYHLWSESYQRNLRDIFLIQDEIANCIVSALKVTLSGKEINSIKMRTTKNIDAYEYYLRGWYYFHKTTKKDLLFAIEMFEKALEEDADFARAWAGIADSYAFLYLYFDTNPEYREKASIYSSRALESCSDLPESHVSRGMAYLLCHEFSAAQSELDKAIELDPNSYEAYYFYGRACCHQGKYALAATMFEKATLVNPEDYQSLLLLPQVYKSLGLEADAVDAGNRGIKAAKKFLQLNPDDSRVLYLGACQLSRQGDIDEGRRWITKAMANNDCDGIVLYNSACFYSQIGEIIQALDYLEKAIVLGMVNKEWLLHDMDLDPLRGEPRFNSLLKDLKSN